MQDRYDPSRKHPPADWAIAETKWRTLGLRPAEMTELLIRSIPAREFYELTLEDRPANKPREIRLFLAELRRIRRLETQHRACLNRLNTALRLGPRYFSRFEGAVTDEVLDYIAMYDPRGPWAYEVKNRPSEPWLDPIVRYVDHALRRKRVSRRQKIKLIHEALKLAGHGDVVTPEKVRYALAAAARSRKR